VIEWFSNDVGAFKAKTPENTNSWYAKFSAVATSMVSNYIALHLAYHKAKYKFTDHTCKEILMRVPTPPWSGRTTIIHFKIFDVPLHEWRLDMDKSGQVSADPEPASIVELGRWKKTTSDIDSGAMSPDLQTMRGAIDTGAGLRKGLDDQLAAEMQKAGPDMFDFESRDFANPAVFGSAPISARRWTPFMEMFAGADQIGRACLVIDSLRCQQFRLHQTSEDCDRRIALYDSQIASLEAEIERYRASRQAVEAKMKDWQNAATRLSHLENQRSEQKNDPFERQRLETIERENRNNENAPPVAHVPRAAYGFDFQPHPRYFYPFFLTNPDNFRPIPLHFEGLRI
jgi:hypothetical protein